MTAAARALGAALVLLALAPAGAAADFRFDGHGWGHGAGLAQWGARGYADGGHRGHAWILAHYYPGTRLVGGPVETIRVRLKEAVALRFSGADLIRATGGRQVVLAPTRTYRLAPSSDALRVRLTDASTGRALATLQAPVRVLPGTLLRLLYLAENGVTAGRYRGTFLVRDTGTTLVAVNDLDMEDYLRGVVPAEMPASWPGAALRAQAVAARSYAFTSLRPAATFDVYADTRSQMYRGADGEASAATTAVRDTRRLVLKSGTAIARTLFSSSSGGVTAAVEDAFPGNPPVSYLRSVDDPYDRSSPYHDWTATLTTEQAAKRLAPVLAGDLVGLEVVATTPAGRAATVRVTGTAGTRDVPAATIRSLLELRSTWFAITAVPASPA